MLTRIAANKHHRWDLRIPPPGFDAFFPLPTTKQWVLTNRPFSRRQAIFGHMTQNVSMSDEGRSQE
jgi:hypothetical protein